MHAQPAPAQPTYQCRYDTYNVKVWLHRVVTHRGAEVFTRMRWTYGRAGHVLRLRVTRGGILDLLTPPSTTLT